MDTINDTKARTTMIIHSALPAFQSSPEGATLLASASSVGLVAVEGSGSVFSSDDMAGREKCAKMREVTEVDGGRGVEVWGEISMRWAAQKRGIREKALWHGRIIAGLQYKRRAC